MELGFFVFVPRTRGSEYRMNIMFGGDEISVDTPRIIPRIYFHSNLWNFVRATLVSVSLNA